MKIINLLPFFLLTILISCKTQNPKISYNQMVAMASVDARKLVNEPEFNECDRGRKEFGDITLKSNMWGRSKIKQGNPVLCTYKKGDNFGWKWEMPKSASGVIAYPALEIGRTPWGSKQRGKIAGFPLKVSRIKNLTSGYDVETHVKHKKFNLSYDFWLTDIELGEGSNIRTEIMIWEDYFDFTSFGKVIDKIQTPFGEYKVHKGHLKNEKFEQDWIYLAFVRTTPRTKGAVDINYLLQYLSRNAHINPEHYFTSIEFGNEIGNSSGITLVKDFNWDLKAN
ncbi:MAG: hypothetical protein HKO54_01100 [Flavobacteriaceae bacterium]|nr:hypothetical protein [Flavobacteriaceae bacterium]